MHDPDWPVPAVLETTMTREQLFADLSAPQPPSERFNCGGVPVEGRREGDTVVVSRVLSTNPADYLLLSPGQRFLLTCEAKEIKT